MMNIIASVISISGIFSFTIINELIAPTIKAAAIADNTAIKVFCENQTNIEMTMAFDKDATEPTDKSKPSTVKEMVMPIAMMVTMEIERKILMILSPLIKEGLTAAKTATRTKIVKIVPYL